MSEEFENELNWENLSDEDWNKRLEIMCSGTLETAPRPGGGTIVTVKIPRK